jgi:hypothetical protein
MQSFPIITAFGYAAVVLASSKYKMIIRKKFSHLSTYRALSWRTLQTQNWNASALKSQFGVNRGAVITLILAKKLNVTAFIEPDNISVGCAPVLHGGISFYDKTVAAQVSGKSLNQWATEVLQAIVL